MCGINGFNFKNKDLIQEMNQTIKYRGPDDDGVFIDSHFSLGHVRLSILDLSPAGHQPMVSDDHRYIIVYNGEIYNFLELKKELEDRGYKFKSKSDTEVILNLYKEFGESFLQKMNGIFAFAILDTQNNKLFLARDRMGVKPLYYFWDKKTFIFSSDLKSILKDKRVKSELDITALNYYFRFLYVPEERSFIKGVKKLKAGHFMTLENDKLDIKEYWDIKNFDDKFNNFEVTKKIVKEKVSQSIKKQLISDRPVGIFLSGGIDSNIVLSATVKNANAQVKTYSVGFDVDVEKEKFNADFYLAKKSSEFFNTEHHELIINAKMVRDNFEKVVDYMGEPFSNFTNFAMYFLSEFAKKDVAVVLGGDGGDELFGGYPRYRYSKLITDYQLLPKSVRRLFLDKIGIKLFGKKFDKFNQEGLEKFLAIRMQDDNDVKKILQDKIYNDDNVKTYFSKFFSPAKTNDYEKNFMYIDLKTWIIDESLARSDKMTMAHGLEQRVPLLDHELAELAFNIPTKYKIKGNKLKYVLKEAFKDDLPEFIYNAEKRGFFAPGAKWLRTALKPLAYELLSGEYNDASKDLFNFDEIKNILDNHINGSRYNLNLILSLMTFQVWYKNLNK